MITGVMLRLIYYCRPEEIWCHRCHKEVRGATTEGPNYTIRTCLNGGGGHHCGERLLVLPPDPRSQFSEPRSTVIRLTKAEAAAIRDTQTANEVLKDIGVFVEAVKKLDGVA